MPSVIRPGHLVELQVSFVAVPTGKRRYHVLNKLRSVCLLDRCVEEVSNLT